MKEIVVRAELLVQDVDKKQVCIQDPNGYLRWYSVGDTLRIEIPVRISSE